MRTGAGNCPEFLSCREPIVYKVYKGNNKITIWLYVQIHETFKKNKIIYLERCYLTIFLHIN